MKRSYLIPLGFALVALVAGCGRGTADQYMERLDPTAPAAAGLPATPGPDEPAPLTERPAFGLYAESPSEETLTELSVGELSPDQRYRAAITNQGLWVARVDGAWLWQIQLPSQTVSQTARSATEDKSAASGETAQNADNAQNTQTSPVLQTPKAAALQWTEPSYLLIKDTLGNWWKADPDWATVTRIATPPAARSSSQQGGQTSNQQSGQSATQQEGQATGQQQGSQTSGQQQGQAPAQQQSGESEE